MKKYGSRAEVFHNSAEMTTGKLTKRDLKKNRYGYIVSLKKSKSSKNPRQNPLLAQGFQQKNKSNTFGPVKSNKNNNLNGKNGKTGKTGKNGKNGKNGKTGKTIGLKEKIFNLFSI